jgi:hypothetical protein
MRASPIRMAITAASLFVAAAFNAMSERQQHQMAVLKSGGKLPNDPTSGAHNYRGGPGNRAYQRQALKKRNQRRHRVACRG